MRKSMGEWVGVIALSLVTGSAWAGADRVGNGGVGVVCRNPVGQILSAEMLDIFEGKNMDETPLVYVPSGLDMDTRIQLATVQMVPNAKFLQDFQTELSKVKANILILPKEDVGLTPTNDAFPALFKKGCAFEQVANYMDDGKIRVDREIYKQLDTLNRTALYVHETIYAVARANVNESNSIRSRKLTAQVLAKNFDAGIIRELMEQLVTPPKPIEPPQPQWPNAFKDIQAGLYHPSQSNTCSFTIDKNDANGRMYLTWINSGNPSDRCNVAGKVVELRCNESYCRGSMGQKIQDEFSTCEGYAIVDWDKDYSISPMVPGKILYEVGEVNPTNGVRCWTFKMSFSQ